MSYVEIENLKVDFLQSGKSNTALNIDSLKIEKGEAYGIIGESGTGKTVLALSMLKLLDNSISVTTCDKLKIGNNDILQQSPKDMQKKIRGSEITMIFQDPMSSLNPVFTIGQQLEEVIKKHKKTPKKELRSEAIRMLELVQLPDPEKSCNKYPHQLSGGQRQRVIIALALSCNSKFLIADEPTRNLDVTIQAGILKLIKDLQEKIGVTLLFIANNPGVISLTCENTAILYKGEIIEKGNTQKILTNPTHPYTKILLDDTSEDEGISSFRHNSWDIDNHSPYTPGKHESPGLFIEIEKDHYVKCAKENRTGGEDHV